MPPIAVRRMMRERAGLEEEKLDYRVFFYDDNILKFDAFIPGPDDSFYRHKLLKLHFEIPEQYPLVPPKVTFIQHSGGRIHPSFYVDGKMCLSMLGACSGQQWAPIYSIHTILSSIRPLLDYEPYRHEPGRDNDPVYNKFVQFTTWRSLLIDYLEHETSGPAKSFLENFIRERSESIMGEISAEKQANSDVSHLSSPYGGQPFVPDYDGLINDMRATVAAAMA